MREIALLEGWRTLPDGGKAGRGVLAIEAIAFVNERVKGQLEESVLRYKTLHHALQEYGVLANRSPARSLGGYLRGLDRKTVSGMTLEKVLGSKNGIRWRVATAQVNAKTPSSTVTPTETGDA
jgi:hypothetical protein